MILGGLWLAGCTAAAQTAAAGEVMDLDEAAALLRVKPEVVQALAESHRIPARRVGDAWRFWHAALLEWLKGDPALEGVAGQAELLPHELAEVTGKGTAPAAEPPQSPAGASQTTVGESPATPTTEDIALRDQRVLLGRGAASFEIGGSYGRSEQTLLPVVRVEENDLGVSGTLRYGLGKDLQVTMRLPATWRRITTFADASITGRTSPSVTTSPVSMAGDGSLSLLGVASREAVGRPTVVWSIDSVLPTGAGQRAVGGGLVFSKSYDPAVLFAGVNYLYGLRVNPSDPRWSLSRNNFGFQVGYTYAVNDTLALSTAFLGTYRNSRSPDGISIAPAKQYYALQVGTTWMVTRGLFMEPAVALGLGADNPGLTVSFSFSRSFRWRRTP
jgi:excisionase family DNA binding protein